MSTQLRSHVNVHPGVTLFRDWCKSTGRPSFPCDSHSLAAFIEACPASKPTLDRRLRAIASLHRSLGLPTPTDEPEVVAAIHHVTGRPEVLVRTRASRFPRELTNAALEIAIVQGWPDAFVGRRDAAILALICVTGLTRAEVLRLCTDDFTEDLAVLRRNNTAVESIDGDDPATCPRCALTRWLRVLATYHSFGRGLVRRRLSETHVTRASASTAHDCSQTLRLVSGRHVFSPIDRYGWLADTPLTKRSVTAVVGARLLEAGRYLDHDEVDVLEPDAALTDSDPTITDRVDELPRRPITYAEAMGKRREVADRMAAVARTLDELDESLYAALAATEKMVNGAVLDQARLRELGAGRG